MCLIFVFFQPKGGVHKFMIVIRENLGDFFYEFLLDLSSIFIAFSYFLIMGSGWSPLPMGFGIGILITGGNL